MYDTPLSYLKNRFSSRVISHLTGISRDTVRHHVSGRRQPGKKYKPQYLKAAADQLALERPKDKRERRAYSNFKKLVIKRWGEECS